MCMALDECSNRKRDVMSNQNHHAGRDFRLASLDLSLGNEEGKHPRECLPAAGLYVNMHTYACICKYIYEYVHLV